ncbi:MAG: hypothetical protein AAFN05_15495, partial [Pseudomonadota bacterium]
MNAPQPSRLYHYVARDAEGRRSASSLSAADIGAARAELRRRGLYPISLMPADGATEEGSSASGGARPPTAPGVAAPSRAGATPTQASARAPQVVPANDSAPRPDVAATVRPVAAQSHPAPPRAGSSGARPARQVGKPRTLRLAEQATLLEALARFTERRITPDRALLILSRGRSPQLATAAETVRRAVRTGRALPDALQEAGALADPAAVALLRAGDA